MGLCGWLAIVGLALSLVFLGIVGWALHRAAPEPEWEQEEDLRERN